MTEKDAECFTVLYSKKFTKNIFQQNIFLSKQFFAKKNSCEFSQKKNFTKKFGKYYLYHKKRIWVKKNVQQANFLMIFFDKIHFSPKKLFG